MSTTGSGKTDANGALNFKVAGYSPAVTSRKVTIAEMQQDGYELVQQNGVDATCANVATGKPVAVTSSGALGFTVNVPQARSHHLLSDQQEAHLKDFDREDRCQVQRREPGHRTKETHQMFHPERRSSGPGHGHKHRHHDVEQDLCR